MKTAPEHVLRLLMQFFPGCHLGTFPAAQMVSILY